MTTAVRVRVRYDTRREDGSTRRELHQRLVDDGSTVVDLAPEPRIPLGGEHLWNWYFDLSDRLQRVRDGICSPVPPTEFRAWVQNTGEIVYPSEYAILGSMDVAFCDEMNKELADYRVRQEPPKGK